jgi:hypothetical protein
MHFLMYDVVGETDKALFHHVMYMNVNFLPLKRETKTRLMSGNTSQQRLGLV